MIQRRAADAGIITAQLNFHDMKVPFLGANGWNSPDFARTADSSIDGAVFVDGFFIDSPTPTVQDFVDRYKKRFQTNPTLFAMQGYDAAKLVIDAVHKGASSGEAVHDQLLSQPGGRRLRRPAGVQHHAPDRPAEEGAGVRVGSRCRVRCPWPPRDRLRELPVEDRPPLPLRALGRPALA